MNENKLVNYLLLVSGLVLGLIFSGLIIYPSDPDSMGEWLIIFGITGAVTLFGFLFCVSFIAILLRPING